MTRGDIVAMDPPPDPNKARVRSSTSIELIGAADPSAPPTPTPKVGESR
jgi:hypothetical protein